MPGGGEGLVFTNSALLGGIHGPQHWMAKPRLHQLLFCIWSQKSLFPPQPQPGGRVEGSQHPEGWPQTPCFKATICLSHPGPEGEAARGSALDPASLVSPGLGEFGDHLPGH
jgi:hypothetical protein